MGNSEEAISHLTKSINLKRIKSTHLISILGIVIEYSKMNNKAFVNEWCDKGISLYTELDNDKP